MWRIGWAPNSIPVYSYIQQDATLHSLFISGNCFTCFGWYFHPSSGAHTSVSTAFGICHTLTAICRYRGRVGTGLSVLWVVCVYVGVVCVCVCVWCVCCVCGVLCVWCVCVVCVCVVCVCVCVCVNEFVYFQNVTQYFWTHPANAY